MNKLETPCIFCGADRVYTHHNTKTAKWTVYCDTCVGGYDSEEEAERTYMRLAGMRDALELALDILEGPCDIPDCPQCKVYYAVKAALEAGKVDG